jgi:hypothetical protein
MTGAEETDRPFAAPSSRAAALATLASIIVSLGGIAGQMDNPETVLFPIIAAIGLAALATIVLAHQHR